MSRASSNPSPDSFQQWLNRDNVCKVDPECNLRLESLEDRVLYSAVPMPLDLVECIESAEPPPEETDFDTFGNADQGLDLIESGMANLLAEETEAMSLDLSDSDMPAMDLESVRTEIVFIDPATPDYQLLVDDILNNGAPDTQYEIVVLDPNANGIGQITRSLDEQSGGQPTYDAIHLVTHGSDGSINLGNSTLNNASIPGYASELVSWQAALNADADLLIYGCEVAETESGQTFIQELADLTGTDVAASDDLTGHSSQNADWDFEFIVGEIETEFIFSEDVIAAWNHTLAAAEITSESGTATGQNVDINANQTIVQVFAQDLGTGNGLDIFYQITDASGTQTAVQVNTGNPLGDQQWASVAIDDDGDFVVVWTDQFDGSDQGVYAKYFAADGSVIRDEFRIDAPGSGGNDASVGIDADGNFVVAWEGSGTDDANGIYAQRFDTSGNEVGSTFLVNDVDSASQVQGNADVAVNASGQFVIAWDTFTDEDSTSSVFTKLYAADGTAISNEIIVETDADRFYRDASVDINNSGNFAVAYASRGTQTAIDAAPSFGFSLANLGTGVFVQTYSIAGSDITAESNFTANDTFLGDQENPSVAVLDNNRVIVAWEGEGTAIDDSGSHQTDENGVFFNEFDLFSGSTTGEETFVDSTRTDGVQQSVTVASNGTDFAFAFDDDGDVLALETEFNFAPASLDNNIKVPTGFEQTLQLDDFDFFDFDGDSLQEIVIDVVPDSATSVGTLFKNGTAVTAGTVITRADIENGEITYRADSNSLGATPQFQYRVSDGMDFSETATLQFQHEESDALLFSFGGSHQFAGNVFDNSEVVAFGGSDLVLGSPSSGQVFGFFDAAHDLNAFHLVDSQTTLNTSPPVTLNPGDVLLSLDSNGSLPGVGSVRSSDIVLFRPDSAGDFSSGTYSILLAGQSGNNLTGLTLVESDTLIGDTTVSEGTFLFSDSSEPTEIQILDPADGFGSAQTLIEADDLDIDTDLNGLELIESDQIIGGKSLTAGTLLVATRQNVTVEAESGDLKVKDDDIFALDFATTTLGSGTATADAHLVFDASTVSNIDGGPTGDISAIAIMSANDEQVLTNRSSITVAEGGTVDITASQLLTTDADTPDSELVYSVVDSPNGSFLLSGSPTTSFTQQDINDGLVSYRNGGGESTTESIALSVDDGNGDATAFTLAVNITPVDDPHVLTTNLPIAVIEGGTATLSNAYLSTADPDTPPEDIVYTVTTLPADGTLLVNGVAQNTFTQQQIDSGAVQYEHGGNENSDDSFEFSVTDSSGAVTTATFNISVAMQNDIPQFIASGNLAVDEGTTGNVITSAYLQTVDNDSASPNELVYQLQSLPAHGILRLNGIELNSGDSFTQQDINDNLLTFDHDGSETTTDAFDFKVMDADSESTPTHSLVIDVAPVDDAPIATVATLSVDVNSTDNPLTTNELNVSDVDTDDTDLVYTIDEVVAGSLRLNGAELNAGDEFTNADLVAGKITFAHDGSPLDEGILRLTLTDGETEQAIELPVNVNHSTEAIDDEFTVTQSNTLTGDVAANDVNTGGSANYSIVDDVDNGTLTFNSDGTFTYTPGPGFAGTDSFEYQIQDTTGQTTVATVNINVLSPPVAVSDSFTVNISEATTLAVLENDSDFDGNTDDLSVVLVTTPASGELLFDASTNELTFTATDSNAVTDQFEYQLIDADGNLSRIATVTLQINQAPTGIAIDNNNVDENTAAGVAIGQITANDLNDDIVLFELADSDNDSTNNPFTIDPNTGVITVNNSALLDFETTTEFVETVIVTDSVGLTSSHQITIFLNPVDEAPVVETVSHSVGQGGTLTGDFSTTAVDPEGDSLTFTLAESPNHGSVTLDSDGNWQYQHDGSDNFNDSFTLLVQDSNGNATEAVVTIDIDHSPAQPTPAQPTPAQPVPAVANAPGGGSALSSILNAQRNNSDAQDSNDFNRGNESNNDSLESSDNRNDAEAQDADITQNAETLAGQLLSALDQINESPDAQSSNNTNGQEGFVALEEVIASQDERQQRFESTQERTLLWQPRYAIYGQQLTTNASLNAHEAITPLQVSEQLQERTFAALGFSQELLQDLNQPAVAGSLSFSDLPAFGLSASSLFTVGYMVWAARASALLSTFISIPAWTHFDPLPVIESGISVNSVENDESLESLVDSST